ncbi:unnamed protein product [Diamesa tonsa]
MSVENAEVANNSGGHEANKMVNGVDQVQHVNGMSNGHSNSDKHKSSSSHKSSHKDRHKDRDKDKERSKDHKSSKSSHRDKDRDKDKDKHSSSNGKDKERHSSSKSSHRDKDRTKERSENDKDKSATSTSVFKEPTSKDDKDKHKSSSSSSKDKPRSSSSSHHSKDKEKHRDREKDGKDGKEHKSSSSSHKHSSSSSGSKHRSKDKEKSSSSSGHRRDKHSSSSSSRRDKDKSSSSRHKDDDNVEVKQENITENNFNGERSPIKNFSAPCERLEASQNSSCDYSLSQFKDEESSLPVKSENDEDSVENNFVAVKEEVDDDDNDNESYEAVKKEEEDESEEDIPLSKRKKVEPDSDDEIPLVARKKMKTEKSKKKKRAKTYDSESESDGASRKKKAKLKPTPATKGAKKAPVESPVKGGRKKKKEEEEVEVWKWWEEKKVDDGTKWKFLEHQGPLFAPPYEKLPKHVYFQYDGKKMELSEDAEEIAGFYARLLDHEYTSKVAFNTNFFKDWQKAMTKSERSVIQDLRKCNFKNMQLYFQEQSEKNKQRTKDEKLELKTINENYVKEYGFCTIDGHKEKIGNFRIEPPGLFRGRGEHPKMGMVKRRVLPNDVVINCSRDSKVPKAPSGHKWKEVRHDNAVSWLASWTENVQNQVKYVMLNPSSKLKGEKDYMKYETARRLKDHIGEIRDKYREEWKSKEMKVRQRAVALYFIDKLALRAGNEKDEDQADTVGCCSLRYEHVTLHEKLNGKQCVVVFDFLGKDSIRYYNEVAVEKRVFKNLELFKDNKKNGDDLFDRLNTAMMNEHLKDLMEGLTAKVFRTFNASTTLQSQLDELTEPDSSVPEKLLSYNRANRAVAILCNHQRAVPKTHDKSMDNLREKIRLKREAVDECAAEVKSLRKNDPKSEQKKKQLERLRDQLNKLEIQETDKDENKTIALGTSKLNYLDPRISVSWCKKFNVPIEKIFNKTQRDKFRWAIEMVEDDYSF